MPLGQGEEASGGTRSASIMNEAFCFWNWAFVFSVNSSLWETVWLFPLKLTLLKYCCWFFYYYFGGGYFMWKIIHDYVGLWDFCLIVCVCVWFSPGFIYSCAEWKLYRFFCTFFNLHFKIHSVLWCVRMVTSFLS